MKRSFIVISFTALLISGLLLSVQAQNISQDKDLLKLAEQFQQQFENRKAQAIRIANATGLPVRQVYEDGRIVELMFFERGRPFYYTTFNADGASVINSDKLYPGGSAGLSLTGSGQTLGIWDGGKVRNTHQELTGRVTQQDGATSLSSHATHVAGTMIAEGVASSARGMSYQADLHAYDWNNDESEMVSAAAGGLKVSQHSYGYVTGWAYGDWSGTSGWHWFGDPAVSETEDYGFGFYSSYTEYWDQIAYDAPDYLVVKSAGNDRNDDPGSISGHYVYENGSWTWSTATRDKDGGTDGYDCIPYRGNAKNILTIGAVSNTGSMASFSGWGPTDDGRIKPDVVAKGVSVYSSTAGGDQSYSSYNGTSMSGPMVSGSIGLLLGHQENLHPGESLLSSTIKGLIIHTADDEVDGITGPDYRYGWGMMDTEKAAAVMSDNAANGLHIYELSLEDSDEIIIPVKSSGNSELRATIAWTDVPGTPPTTSLNPTDLMLVNDLDIQLVATDESTYSPYILDPANPSNAATTGDNYRDNVEVVNITSPGNDEVYLVKISHKGTLSGGSQPFSLIVTGNESFEYQNLVQAFDEASNYTTWGDSDNQGYGFNHWEFFSGGSGGSYLGISGLGSSSFGIYAGGDGSENYFTARRDFPVDLPVGSTFSIDLGITGVASGGETGISLFSGSDFRLTFKYIGGSSEWVVNDGGSDFGTGIPFSADTPVNFSFTRGDGNDYSLDITQGQDEFTASDFTASSGAMNISRIELFSTGQGSGENLGFDNLAVNPDLSALTASDTVFVKGILNLAENLEIAELIIDDGQTLVVNPGINLTVNGSIKNLNSGSRSAEGFVIKSDETGTASVIHNSPGAEGIMERYIQQYTGNSDGWHLLASPVDLFTIAGSDFEPGSNDDFYAWDEAGYQWLNYKVGSNYISNFENGTGYLVAYETTATKDFAGTFNHSDVIHTNLSVSSGSGEGWHLLGNPFQSALHWTNSGSTWDPYNIASGAKIMNPGGTYTDITAGGANQYIPANQGFFVQATDADNSLNIPAAERVHNSTSFYKSEIPSLLTIRAGDGEFYVETWIQVMEDATAGFDEKYDVRFFGGMYHAPYLYSKISEADLLSTNRIAPVQEETTIQLVFKSFLSRTFTITAKDVGSFEEDMDIILEDTHENIQLDLREMPEYTFMATANELTERFKLHLLKSTGILEAGAIGGLNIYAHDNILYLNSKTNLDAQISIYNVTGQTVYSERARLEGLVQISTQLPAGWYVVKVTTSESIASEKVFIR